MTSCSRVRSPFASSALGAVALLLVSCGGGGSKGSTPGLLANADLNGAWNVTLRTTRVTAGCAASGTVVGAEQTVVLPITFTRATGTVTVDAGTPDEVSGRLNGLTVTFTESDADGSSRVTITFNRAGTSFSGSGVVTTTADGCTENFSLAGTKGSQPTSGIGSIVSSVRAGNVNGTFVNQPLPSPSLSINATVQGGGQVVAGGSAVVTVSSTDQFNSVAVGVRGIAGHVRVDLPASVSSTQLLFALQALLPSLTDGLPAIPCQFQCGVNGQFGPPTDFTFQVEQAGQGNLNVNLTWDTVADLDLHLEEPTGFVIFFGAPISPSGGQLDLDGNAACDTSRSVENITYPQTAPPSGTYRVFVDTFDTCNTGTTSFAVRVNQSGSAPLIEVRQTSATTQNPVEILSFTR